MVGDLLSLLTSAGTFDDFAAEAFDLVRGGGAEALVEGFAGFQFFAVDE